MRELPFELCDVFTDRPLAGNALAVFTDADDIDGATMQALARETNLSETAFLSPRSPNRYDLRWMTPEMEVDLFWSTCVGPPGNRSTISGSSYQTKSPSRPYPFRCHLDGEAGVTVDPFGCPAQALSHHFA